LFGKCLGYRTFGPSVYQGDYKISVPAGEIKNIKSYSISTWVFATLCVESSYPFSNILLNGGNIFGVSSN